MEIELWSVGAPYKMAWRGTRFIANRTFLRFAHYGCTRCIAFAMSELHWGIRATLYGDVVEEDKIVFVWNEIQDLKDFAGTLEEEEDYNMDMDREDIVGILQ